jgi:SAM-dependent methyltransferase
MNHREAVALIRDVIPSGGGTWADLGAGSGTFTRALAELVGAEGRVYAVERDPRAVDALTRLAGRGAGASVIPVRADFTAPFDLPGLGGASLDGILMANALHFVPEPAPVLEALARRLRPGGRLVVVEYDGRKPNRWVPYPIPAAEWERLSSAAGLTSPILAATRPSAFGGTLYVATAERG